MANYDVIIAKINYSRRLTIFKYSILSFGKFKVMFQNILSKENFTRRPAWNQSETLKKVSKLSSKIFLGENSLEYNLNTQILVAQRLASFPLKICRANDNKTVVRK